MNIKSKTGSTVRVRGLATGKPSKVLYKSPEGSTTNMISVVSFGKQAKKSKLNSINHYLNQKL